MFRGYPTAARRIPANTPPGVNIGVPLSVTDGDHDAPTYRLGRPRPGVFDLDASSGQLLTLEALTGVRRGSYQVFLPVSDGRDDLGNPEPNPVTDATTEVTITLSPPVRGAGGSADGGGSGAPQIGPFAFPGGDCPDGSTGWTTAGWTTAGWKKTKSVTGGLRNGSRGSLYHRDAHVQRERFA